MKDYAVIHPNFQTRGGAERVAEELARTVDSPLIIGFGEKRAMTEDDIEYISIFNSILTKFFNRGSLRDLYHFWSWQKRPELTEYKTLIFSGNEASWYVPTEDQRVIRYVHHPPHTAYDHYQQTANGRLTRLYTLAIRTLIHHTLPFTDEYISCSEVVADRLEKYWNINSKVIHPPVEVDNFTVKDHAERDDYYLVISRLVPRKRVDTVVKVFNDMPDKSLVIAGEGIEKHRLKELASDNIELKGYVTEEEKEKLLSNTKCLIMPTMREDFGIVPIEAMASGTPVIGTNEGFTKYHINDNENGLLYEIGNLKEKIQQFETDGVENSAEEIKQSVEYYRPERFRNEIEKIL